MLVAKLKSWRMPWVTNVSAAFAPCAELSSNGDTACLAGGVCAEGYAGVLCSACVAGYARSGAACLWARLSRLACPFIFTWPRRFTGPIRRGLVSVSGPLPRITRSALPPPRAMMRIQLQRTTRRGLHSLLRSL